MWKPTWYWLTDGSQRPPWFKIFFLVISLGAGAVALSGFYEPPLWYARLVGVVIFANILWFLWNWFDHRGSMRRSRKREKPFSTLMLPDPTMDKVGVNLTPRSSTKKGTNPTRE